ncbi:MAG: amino acid ABC transporter substrate-binding protein [Micrococcales bacterium]|nr:amino acid ABC transporter substrate-binding protein [Micrococcales bacterium]
MPKLKIHRFAVAAAAGLLLLGCSASDASDADSEEVQGDVVVVTTNFTESKIMASMYQQVLRASGVDAGIKELTSREVIIPALSKGEVQISPDYLSSFTEFLNKQENGSDATEVASANVEKTFTEAKRLAEPAKLTVLPPAEAQDQNAFAVTQEFAAENNLKTLSQLGEYSQASPITLGAGPECPERPFCLPGLEEVYDVQIEKFVPLDSGGPLTVQGLKQGLINVGVVFSSSGSISAQNLAVLADDKKLQVAENLIPVVYTPAVTPTVTKALNSVSAVLTTKELQQLNEAVDIERKQPEQVATEFLESKGLLPK